MKIQASGLNFPKKMGPNELQKIKLTHDAKEKKRKGSDPFIKVKAEGLSEENSRRRKKNCVFKLGERDNAPMPQNDSPSSSTSSTLYFTFSNSQVGRSSQNRGLCSEGTDKDGEETWAASSKEWIKKHLLCKLGYWKG